MSNIEERIQKLENGISAPGTTLQRTVLPEEGKGFGWVLSVGKMSMPKEHFYGQSIEECLDSAEEKLL